MWAKNAKKYNRIVRETENMNDVPSVSVLVNLAKDSDRNNYINFKDKPVIREYKDELMRQSQSILANEKMRIFSKGAELKQKVVKGNAKLLQRDQS
jgi:hypothetical protein